MAGKTLTVYLAADLKNFNAGIKQADTSLSGMVGNLKNNMGPVLAAVGAAAGAMAVKVGVDSVKAASDLNETMSAASVIFGDAAEGVFGFAETANLSLGQTREQAIDAANTFGTFGKAAGLSGQQLVGFTRELVTLSSDLASFKNVRPEEAIQALGSALRGEAEPMRKFGVLLDDATLKQKAMEMGLYDGNGALTQQQKVLAAYRVIMDQTSDAQGDFQRTQGSLANQSKILNAAFEDLKTSFGEGLTVNLKTATNGTSDLGQGLVNLQKPARLAGYFISDMAEGFLNANGPIGLLTRLLPETSTNLDRVAESARYAGLAMYYLGQAQQQAATATSGNTAWAARYTAQAQALGAEIGWGTRGLQRWNALMAENEKTTRGGSSATTGMTEAQQKLNKAFEAQEAVLDKSNTALESAVGKWQAARDAVTDYADTMSQRILGGIDLGEAYKAQFDEAGKETGKTMLAAFNDQIAQAQWFANVLGEIKRQGADQSLIDHISSLGPETGGALAQQMIGEKGLVGEINKKWIDVRTAVQEQVANTLIPDSLLAGQEYAATMVTAAAAQVKEDQDRLRKIGKAIGKPIGAQMKVEIAEAVAEAVAQAQAAGTAARAEAYAAEERRQQAITNQAIAQMLNKIQSDANARTGYNQAPVVR